MQNNSVRVVVVAPGKEPEVKLISNTLLAFQDIVGGYLEMLSIAPELISNMHIYLNEEGVRLKLSFNRYVNGHRILGTFFASRIDDEGEEIGFTEEEAELVRAMLKKG